MSSKFLMILILAIIMFIPLYKYLGFETLFERFDQQKINLATGEGTNRIDVYKMGLNTLRNDSYILGNGYAFSEIYKKINNGKSKNLQFIDAHNLYLTLPLYFGWFGTFLFLLLFLNILYLLWNIKGDLSYPFISLWVIFLINQFKITFIRDPHYETIIFILLGISYSYYISKRKFLIH
jgi:O-antigen ligase